MAGADGDSPAAVASRTLQRAARMADPSPVLNALAVSWAQQTAAAFRNERSPAGEDWPRLAPSTIARRAAKLSGARGRSKKTGRITKGAQAKRADARARYAAGAPGVFKPLVDSGRLRQSIRYVARRDGIEISAVAYIAHHVTGTLTVRRGPPKRNPLVIEIEGGKARLIASAHAQLVRALPAFFETGNVPALEVA